ncbi:MAG: DUF2935 domain-containing protein [Lachnospiraceae bacterium]
MENFITLSIETHLFFARIMKEHALFLEAGFPCKDEAWVQRADGFRRDFEQLLGEVLRLANGRVSRSLLRSGELVTEYTIPAENRTEALSGIEIDSNLSRLGRSLRAGIRQEISPVLISRIQQINERALRLLDGLIAFKRDILKEVANGTLFNVNYPLLVEHIIREAELYRATIAELQKSRTLAKQTLCEMERFWNQIMMEHALFIRGLLDPSEEQLIDTADNFADQYKELLKQARAQDCRTMDPLTRKTLETTLKYRDFKAAGASGILNRSIASIILPLLADHVLREANHYIRILETGRSE